jgi:hypothetical protein
VRDGVRQMTGLSFQPYDPGPDGPTYILTKRKLKINVKFKLKITKKRRVILAEK